MEFFGDTLEALFEHAAEGFTDIITDPAALRSSADVEISLEAADTEALLIEWLTELIYQFDAHGWLFREFHIHTIEHGHLSGIARGERYNPTQHPIHTTVKGATYHQLQVRRSGNGWKGRVIFDL